MIEWLDWWLNSEEMGRTLVGAFIALVAFGLIFAKSADELDEHGAENVFVVTMGIATFLSALTLVAALPGALFLRLIGWVVTGA